MTDVSKVMDVFLDIEKELNLFDREFDGFHFWNYTRVYLYNTILKELNGRGEAFPRENIGFSRALSIARGCIFNSQYKFKYYKKKKDILIMGSPRKMLVEGKYKSIYSDFIADNYSSTLTVERPFNYMHFTPSYSQNNFYLDSMFVSREICVRVMQRFRPISVNISDLIGRIKEELGADISEASFVKRISYLYYRYKITKKYFNKMLDAISPKIVILICYYNFENLVLIEVCREKGIPSLEIQHGLTGKMHSAYNFGCYNKNILVPDIFCTYSSFWSDSIRLPKELVRVYDTGSVFYDEQIVKYKKSENPKAIIFLSSGTVGNRLSEIAYELSTMIDSKYQIIYKLHPGEYENWKSRYSILDKAPNIQVIDNADTSLYELFSQSIMQVGVYSTALYEGLGYNLKTLVLDIPDAAFVSDLIALNYATLIKDAKDILSKLDDCISNYDSDMFWKKDAAKNICEIIDRVI